jgi:hypothetical protein
MWKTIGHPIPKQYKSMSSVLPIWFPALKMLNYMSTIILIVGTPGRGTLCVDPLSAPYGNLFVKEIIDRSRSGQRHHIQQPELCHQLVAALIIPQWTLSLSWWPSSIAHRGLHCQLIFLQQPFSTTRCGPHHPLIIPHRQLVQCSRWLIIPGQYLRVHWWLIVPHRKHRVCHWLVISCLQLKVGRRLIIVGIC